jgi:ribosomal protein S18 acetylase RimI-like enzyme
VTQVVAASEFGDDALAQCFTAAFDGYVAGSFAMDAHALPRFLRRQGAERALGRAVVQEGRLVGFAFVGTHADVHTGRLRRRIGGMGVREEARGTGAARALLRQVVEDARDAGAHTLELEVFVQNTPAVGLYRACGFADGESLWGFKRAPGRIHAPPDEPVVVALAEAADWLLRHGPADLPYQVSGHALRTAEGDLQAWRLGEALLVFAETGDRLVVASLFDAHPAQREAWRLLRTLIARHPAHAVHAPQLMRDDVAAAAFRAAGFDTLPLHQMQMRLPLA